MQVTTFQPLPVWPASTTVSPAPMPAPASPAVLDTTKTEVVARNALLLALDACCAIVLLAGSAKLVSLSWAGFVHNALRSKTAVSSATVQCASYVYESTISQEIRVCLALFLV